MDRVVQQWLPHHPQPFDRDGELAAGGLVDEKLLATLKAHPYFEKAFPKSTGQESFGMEYLLGALEACGLSEANLPDPSHLLAALARLSAETLVEGIRRAVPQLRGCEALLSGGGAHNGHLVGLIRQLLPDVNWLEQEALGVHPDAKEAVIFALLANQSLWGDGFLVHTNGSAGSRTWKQPMRIGFGKLSFPN